MGPCNSTYMFILTYKECILYIYIYIYIYIFNTYTKNIQIDQRSSQILNYNGTFTDKLTWIKKITYNKNNQNLTIQNLLKI